MFNCLKCGATIEDGSKFCMECGEPIPQTKECPKCHAQLKLNAKFCSECGYSFSGKYSAGAGLVLGDKNVIAGDVVGRQESYSISGNATIVKNEDETKKMVKCHVCGKHLPISGAFTCPECHEIACAECYDKERGFCVSCSESADAKNVDRYRACLAKVYEDGRVEMSERRELEVLQTKLGLSSAEAAELEKPFKLGRQAAADELGPFEKMYCEQALELLLGAGDVDAALKTIETVYVKHPHDETVLGVYLPVLALNDAKVAQKTMDSLGVDVESIALTRIDLALRAKNLVTAEARIKSAVALWPKSRSLKVRELICHYMAYMKFHKENALNAALAILKGLPPPLTKLENSYDFYVKSLFAVDLPEGFPFEERTVLAKKGLYAALTNGLLFGIQPVLVDDLIQRCTKELETENAKLNLSPKELHVLKAAAAKHEPGAAYVYGTYTCATGNAKERKNGLELIRLSAETGHAAAQFAMGNHETSNQETLTQVPDWYRKSADQGYAPAVAKVAALEKQIKANQKVLTERQAAEAKAKVAKQAVEEEARREKSAKAAYAAAAGLRDFIANGLVKIPNTELFIGKTQVTQAIWQCVMGENPSHFKGNERPVESVSLEDCVRFLEVLNSRSEVSTAKIKPIVGS